MRLFLNMVLVVLLGAGPMLVMPVHALDLNDLTKSLDEVKKKAKKNKKKADAARGKVSTSEEIKIGGNVISGLLGAAPLVDDARLQKYVNDVGFWVASQSGRKKLPWNFGVIQSPGVNAFAAPGGYIVITLGLYQLLENEAQLAAVLAHEIAHVVGKHHLKALQKTMKREFWSNMTVSAVGSKKDAKKLKKMINAGVQLYTTGLDRKYEYQADLRGVVLAARAGYDPYALLDVLTTIESMNPKSEELAVMMNSHPPTGERIKLLDRKMEGRLNAYSSGKTNRGRFEKVAAKP